MKTVFKVGMEVYDQVNNPYKKGKVHNINEDEFCHKIHSYDYPIEVQFEGNKGLDYYDLEGCPVWSPNPTLSTSPYTLQGFEQKAPTPTYEEVIKEARSKGDYYYLPDCLEAPSEELVDATIALLKLLFLRDYYNEGWQPDWEANYIKHCIGSEGESLRYLKQIYNSKILCFKTEEIRDRFFEDQKELLEIAKPLL